MEEEDRVCLTIGVCDEVPFEELDGNLQTCDLWKKTSEVVNRQSSLNRLMTVFCTVCKNTSLHNVKATK